MSDGGKLWVSPEGELFNAANAGESERFKTMGYRLPTGADIKRNHIKAVYTRDYSAGEAALYGAVEGVPFLNSAVAATANFVQPGSGDAFAAKSELAQEQHPFVAGAAQLATGTAAFVGGEGLVGAGLKGAEFLQGSTAVQSVANAAVKSGAASALVGTASRADVAIMHHITGTGGDEKLFAHLGYGALADAAIGAAIPVGIGGVKGATKGLAKAFAGAGEVLSNTEGRKATLALQKIQTAYESARATDVHQVFVEAGLDKKTAEQALEYVQKTKLPELEAQYAALRKTNTNRLTTAEGQALQDSIKGSLQGSIAPGALKEFDTLLATPKPKVVDVVKEVGPKTGKKFEVKVPESQLLSTPEASLDDLVNLRESIDRRINYKTQDVSPLDRKLFQARQEVGTAIRSLLEQSDVAFGGSQAEQWVALDRDYSAMKVIQNVIEPEAVKQSALAMGLDKADKSLANLHIVSSLSGFLTVPTAAVHGAVKVAKKALDTQALAKSARFISSKVLEPAAERMTTAVESGLFGLGQAAATTLATQVRTDDFDNRFAQVQWSAANPDKAVANITTALVEGGADTDMAGQVALKAQMANAYMAQNAPGSVGRGSRLVPSRPGLSTTQKREWMSLYKTIQDPAHGILHPTAANIRAMETFYPAQLASTREAIVSQIQNSPDLPMASRMYASRVLQQPVDALTSPFLSKILGQAQMEQEMEAQQQQQTSGAPKSGVASGQTRLQRLQED